MLDEVAETDEATLLEILHSISHLNDADCDRVVSLQKYHETLYLFGLGVPRYQFVKGRPIDMNA